MLSKNWKFDWIAWCTAPVKSLGGCVLMMLYDWRPNIYDQWNLRTFADQFLPLVFQIVQMFSFDFSNYFLNVNITSILSLTLLTFYSIVLLINYRYHENFDFYLFILGQFRNLDFNMSKVILVYKGNFGVSSFYYSFL